MAFRKKFIIGDESLNTYGTWLLNAGADMSYLEKYPVAYYDHKDWEVPIAHWENIQLNKDNQWEAEIVIEGADEREKMYIRKIESGDIRGASFGLDILATSDEAKYLKQGQTHATITAWQPYEISICPSPGNINASVVLRNQNSGIRLNSNSGNDLIEKILPNIHNSKKLKKMDKIAVALGLPTDATEDTILNALKPVLEKSTQTTTLSKYVEDLAKETLDENGHKFFVELNKTNPAQALDFLKLKRTDVADTVTADAATIEAKTTPAPAVAKLSDVLEEVKKLGLSKNIEDAQDDKTSYDYLQRNNPKELARIKNAEPAKFKEMQDAYVLSRKKK